MFPKIYLSYIETCIKDNVQKKTKLHCMKRILDEYGNFNRITFGDSLYYDPLLCALLLGTVVPYGFFSAISSAQNI